MWGSMGNVRHVGRRGDVREKKKNTQKTAQQKNRCEDLGVRQRRAKTERYTKKALSKKTHTSGRWASAGCPPASDWGASEMGSCAKCLQCRLSAPSEQRRIPHEHAYTLPQLFTCIVRSWVRIREVGLWSSGGERRRGGEAHAEV